MTFCIQRCARYPRESTEIFDRLQLRLFFVPHSSAFQAPSQRPSRTGAAISYRADDVSQVKIHTVDIYSKHTHLFFLIFM